VFQAVDLDLDKDLEARESLKSSHITRKDCDRRKWLELRLGNLSQEQVVMSLTPVSEVGSAVIIL
jgi:hypothetical protein